MEESCSFEEANEVFEDKERTVMLMLTQQHVKGPHRGHIVLGVRTHHCYYYCYNCLCPSDGVLEKS